VSTLADTGGVSKVAVRNNSGLDDTADWMISSNKADIAHGDVVILNFGNVAMSANTAIPPAGLLTPPPDNNIATSGVGTQLFDIGLANSTSTIAGVQLGINTDASGKLYFKVVTGAGGAVTDVYAYKDNLMREEDMVAKTAVSIDPALGLATGDTVILDAIWNEDHTASTGLGISLVVGTFDPDLAYQTLSFDIQFANQGARVFAAEYGADNFIQVQQVAGSIFTTYEDQADYRSAMLIEVGKTFRLNGQDAAINVNGKKAMTTGLNLNFSTQDVQAHLTFNSGKTGTTTIAQVGYGEGSIFSKNHSLTFSKTEDASIVYSKDQYAGFTALLNNACHLTQEVISNFNGGMQLQLGEGAGDQNRTVIGLKSMATTELGKVTVTGNFQKGSAVIETRMFSIQDVMGGQKGDLRTNPPLAMKIIEKAISDVSEMRAVIGAVQANLLQTNENNLRVAVENITKTESFIRDTDMASEMTDFTKFQILQNVGVSMLTQANAITQNVLQLLR
ncbi:MAG: hypothetical protein FWG11_09130, partial [Promicromonosporaceae bacterium]|nr:hypothetical protein [Promicromonosporaceae bacterium]